jgi:serine/threonine protein kinase
MRWPVADENRLGRDYLLYEELAETAWAIVRRGITESDGSVIAAKILKPAYATDRQVRALFLREEAALQELRHESVVQLRELIAERGVLALVLEHVDGDPLGECAASIPAARAPGIAAQVAAAMATAHALDVSHPGLTPESILVVRGSTPPRVKVSGFGSAEPQDRNSYTAPEAGEGAAGTAAADVFSLGAILAALFPSLAGIVADCTAAEPDARPSAAELATRMSAAAEASTPVAETPTAATDAPIPVIELPAPVVEAPAPKASAADPVSSFPAAVERPEARPFEIHRTAMPSTVENGPEPGAPAPTAERRRRLLVPALAGVTVAVALVGFNLNAGANRTTGTGAPAAGTPSSAAASAVPTFVYPASPSPSPEAPPAVELRATMAAHMPDGAGTLYLAMRDGHALAYLCDGKEVEAWFRGTASGGELKLSGRNGNTMTGAFTHARATGTVTVKGKAIKFTIPTVKKPSGLYRAATRVRNAKVDGTWIVLPDGTQVGVLVTDGVPGPAPTLDLAHGTTSIDGTMATVVETDVETGAGLD